MDIARIAALDIGGTKIASALVELGDNVSLSYKESVPTKAQEGSEQVLARSLASLERVISCAGHVDALAISSAGVIDPQTGAVSYANELMPGWMGTPLAHAVEQRFGLSCKVLNDVHAHALGEARRGAGKGAQSLLVVAVGTGIGGAFVEDGRIMLGAHNEAGHIGHMCCVDARGIPCSCGAEGHLEPIAAGPGIIEEYLRLKGEKLDIDGAEIDVLARQGDVCAMAAQARAGRALGEVLGSVSNMLDPELILLSGSVAQCGPSWREALEAGFARSAMPPVATTAIVAGSLGGDAPLIGAAEHALHSAYA